MKRKPKIPDRIRLPAAVRELLSGYGPPGSAWLYGIPVLDLLSGLPVGPGLADWVRTGPAPAVPVTALGISVDSTGRLADPYGALPAFLKRSVTVAGGPARASSDTAAAMAALAMSSRYGSRLGPSTTKAVDAAVPGTGGVRPWLDVLVTGRHAARVLTGRKAAVTAAIPALGPCVGLVRNPDRHMYDVYDHMAHAVGSARTDALPVRLALLLHDVGKARPVPFPGRGHAVAGRDMADAVLSGLGYPDGIRHRVLDLVLYHDCPIHISRTGVETWLRRLGPDGLAMLMEVKYADIAAHGPEASARLMAEWEGAREGLLRYGIDIP